MKALVIGYGSIGRRHAANLAKLGHEVVLLRHAPGAPPGTFREYYDFDKAIDEEKPGIAVVCAPPPCHASDAGKLIERGIPFLLEKPPALDRDATLALHKLIEQKSFQAYELAFNLRWYPPLQFIHNYLPKLGKIYSMRVSAGAWLPGWRPSVDYRQTTSAKPELGGGVHIELVHEIDYILWFLGMPSRVVAHVGTVGDLGIKSADLCVAMMLYPDGKMVELHLDYLSHKNLRGCQIIAQHGTLEWNFSDKTVRLFAPRRDPEELFRLNAGYDFNQTYLDELQNFIGVVNGTATRMVSMSQGCSVMQILQAMIDSSASRQWVDIPQ
jgi:predicted dehydrogenase